MLVCDIIKNREAIKTEKGSWPGYILCESVIFFLATFGISDSALNTLFFRWKDKVSFKNLPGTIIVGATLPVCATAISYVASTKVDMLTVAVLIVSCSIGARFGAVIIGKCKENTIRYLVASALLLSAVILTIKTFVLGDGTGTLYALTPLQLVFMSVYGIFIGSLAMVGLGATPPMVAMLMLLGFNPIAALAVVITSNSFSCFVGGLKLIKQGIYNKKPAVAMTVFGTPCAVLATRFVHYIDTGTLQLFMISVLILGAVTILLEKKKQSREKIFEQKNRLFCGHYPNSRL